MTRWWDAPLAGLDFETSAADPSLARAVTATVLVDHPGQVVEPINWLVAVTEPIPAEATAVHGITTEHAQTNGEPLGKVISEISALLAALWHDQIPVVVYNAPYDFTVLNCERIRCNMEPLCLAENLTPIIDPLCIDKRMDRYRRGSRKLGAVCEHYGVKLDNAHSSDADALAAVKLARRLGERYARDLAMSLRTLFHDQRTWYQIQAANLELYFRQKAECDGISRSEINAIHCERHWPVKPIPMPVAP